MAWELLKKGQFSAAKDALTAEIKTNAGEEIERIKAERDAGRKQYLSDLNKSAKRTITGAEMINYDQTKITPWLADSKYGNYLEGKYGDKKDGYQGNKDASSMQAFLESVAGLGAKPDSTRFDPNNTDPPKDDKLTDGINSISGGGKSVRNVQVTIGKLIESFNVHSGSVKEGAGEMRDIVQEELIKALQGYEIAAG
jgi:hypothetical protein